MLPLAHTVEYQRASRPRGDSIRRGVCAVGALHALACVVYLGQRSWQWAAGSEQTLGLSQDAAMAVGGLLSQLLAAAAMFLLCSGRFFSQPWATRKATAIASALLGTLWLVFGLLDDASGWFGTGLSLQTALQVFYDLLRELNQFAVPLAVAYVLIRPRPRASTALLAYLAMIIACLSYVGPNADYLIRYPQQPWIWSNTGFREWSVSVGAFSTALMAILLLRRPWRWVALLPLAAWLVRDACVNAPHRVTRWQTLPTGEFFLRLMRELSFLTVTATGILLGVVVFTIFRLPKPKRVSDSTGSELLS